MTQEIVPDNQEVEVAESDSVKFSNGQDIKFGKRAKSAKVVDTDAKTVTFYVKNGQMVIFDLAQVSEETFLRLALHGAAQKIGDDAAGVEDPDDIYVAFETLRDRLYNNEWSAERAKGEFSGASDLVRAVVEVTGRAVEVVKEGLKTMPAADKAALRANVRVKAVLDRLSMERLAKKPGKDSDELLASFA